MNLPQTSGTVAVTDVGHVVLAPSDTLKPATGTPAVSTPSIGAVMV